MQDASCPRLLPQVLHAPDDSTGVPVGCVVLGVLPEAGRLDITHEGGHACMQDALLIEGGLGASELGVRLETCNQMSTTGADGWMYKVNGPWSMQTQDV